MGAHARRARALLSLPAALPHRGRAVRLLFHPRESGRENFTAWDTHLRRRCKSIPSRKNRSIIFCRARACFRWARRDATWAASSARTGTFPNRNPTRCARRTFPPEDVVALAIRYGCPSIAFTYNEPTIWGEYVIDICHAAREAGIRTVMVTNGYVTREAFHDIYDHVDAANVDLKAFTEGFYGRITLTHLQPVLDVLTWLKQETNVWFEITNLLIPTLNDDPRTKFAGSPIGSWSISARTFRCISRRFILISSCETSPGTPPETLHAARQNCARCGTSLRIRRKYS